MIKLLYFIILVIFLLILKHLVFTPIKEQFHIIDTSSTPDDETPPENPLVEEHTHTTSSNTKTDDALEEIISSSDSSTTTTTSSITTTTRSVLNGVNTDPPSYVTPFYTEDANLGGSSGDTGSGETGSGETYSSVSLVNIVSPEHDEALDEPNRIGFNELNPIITVPSDNKCCGVNIYEKKLENINKCITQHIANDGSQLNPEYKYWKEIDEEENECKNPHYILSKTSNCHDIVNEYKNNINTLLCLTNEFTEKCTYNHVNDKKNESSGLSDNDKYSIFLGNVNCEDSSKNENLINFGETGYKIKNCAPI